MTTQAIVLLLTFLAILLVLSYPLGSFIAKLSGNGRVPGFGWLSGVEKVLYRAAGVNPEQGMAWKTYAFALLVF